jgi:hypothetical protein
MKTTNNYALSLTGDFFEKCPKAVFAALAISLLRMDNATWEERTEELRKEWEILHDNGIVNQKAPSLR